ncbi:MAG: CPBP family intramembrane metalloprotease [Pseudobacteriovorax sp.]|nr:CPBP family intramembrane metalloprotease [Pseudobacteriovorax sp.]
MTAIAVVLVILYQYSALILHRLYIIRDLPGVLDYENLWYWVFVIFLAIVFRDRIKNDFLVRSPIKLNTWVWVFFLWVVSIFIISHLRDYLEYLTGLYDMSITENILNRSKNTTEIRMQRESYNPYISAFVVPFVEEFDCRFVLISLGSLILPRKLTIVLSIFLFALAHNIIAWYNYDFYNVLAMFPYLIMGILLVVLHIKFGLFYAIFFHALTNSMVAHRFLKEAEIDLLLVKLFILSSFLLLFVCLLFLVYKLIVEGYRKFRVAKQ